jgi:hypothetical protein
VERQRIQAEAQARLHTERKRIEEELRAKLEEQQRHLESERRDELEASEAKRKAELEERRTIEEQFKRQIEEERQRLVEEQQRLLEAERKRIEREAGLKAAEESRRRQEEVRIAAEAARLQAETERRQDEEAETRKRIQEEAQRELEAERARLEREAAEKLKAEQQRIQEELRAKLQQQQHEHALAEQKQRAEREVKVRAEEEERRRIEAAYEQQMEEERRRVEKEQREQLETQQRRIEEEARQRADDEATRREEEERRLLQEKQRKEEEAERLRLAEVERTRQEQEAFTKNHEEAVKQAISEGRRLAHKKKLRMYFEAAHEFLAQERYEDAMKEVTKVYLVNPDDAEAKRIEMEIYEARQGQQKRKEGTRRWREEHLHKVEALQKQIAEHMVKEREEEEKRAIRKAKIDASLKKVEEFYRQRHYDKARTEIETVYAIDPSNTKAQDYEMDILNDLNRREEARRVFEQRANRGAMWKRDEDAKERVMNERRSSLRKEAITVYRSFLKHLWGEGIPGEEEVALLKAVRTSLAINENDHGIMERSIRLETYTEVLRKMLETNGGPRVGDVDATEGLRRHLGISIEQHVNVMENLITEREEPSL